MFSFIFSSWEFSEKLCLGFIKSTLTYCDHDQEHVSEIEKFFIELKLPFFCHHLYLLSLYLVSFLFFPLFFGCFPNFLFSFSVFRIALKKMPSIRETLREMGVSPEQVLTELAQMNTPGPNNGTVPTPLTNYLDVRFLFTSSYMFY